jgi:hypothetical protein
MNGALKNTVSVSVLIITQWFCLACNIISVLFLASTNSKFC